MPLLADRPAVSNPCPYARRSGLLSGFSATQPSQVKRIQMPYRGLEQNTRVPWREHTMR